MVNDHGIVTTWSPRTLGFINACLEAERQITLKFFTSIISDYSLSPSDYYQKNVTQIGQEKLHHTSDKVNVLMLNILINVIEKNYLYCANMYAFAEMIGDARLFGKMLKEQALPIIEQTVVKLEDHFPGIVDLAIVVGISSLAATTLVPFQLCESHVPEIQID